MSRKIRTAAVIGSGVMGGGIAALLASAGVKTLLLDIVPFDLKEAEKNNPGCQKPDRQGRDEYGSDVKTGPSYAAKRR